MLPPRRTAAAAGGSGWGSGGRRCGGRDRRVGVPATVDPTHRGGVRERKRGGPGGRATRWPPPGGWGRPAWWWSPRPAATPSDANDRWRVPLGAGGAPTNGAARPHTPAAVACPTPPPPARRHATAHAPPALSAPGAGARAPPVHPSRRCAGACLRTRGEGKRRGSGGAGGGGEGRPPLGGRPRRCCQHWPWRRAARGGARAVWGRGEDATGGAVAWAAGSPAGGRASTGG